MMPDTRTPRELVESDAHRYPAGHDPKRPDVRIIYVPDYMGWWDRMKYVRIVLRAEPESKEDAQKRRDEFKRAGGGCACDQCGLLYNDHPADPDEPCLTILCDRSRVKL